MVKKMKKNFKFYAIIWAILLAAWCAVVFLVRPVIPGYSITYDGRFWVAFVFIVLAFVGNLICAYFAFKAENAKKMFYNIPLIRISWGALIAMLVVGSVLMLIPDCPAWIAAIVCILILAFNAIAVVKALWAVGAVEAIDDKVKEKTSFIKNLTVNAESFLAHAKSDAVKAECKKVYEAIRYSDPMSDPALSLVEAQITVRMNDLALAVGADDAEKAKVLADEIVAFVDDRNKQCKALK